MRRIGVLRGESDWDLSAAEWGRAGRDYSTCKKKTAGMLDSAARAPDIGITRL